MVFFWFFHCCSHQPYSVFLLWPSCLLPQSDTMKTDELLWDELFSLDFFLLLWVSSDCHIQVWTTFRKSDIFWTQKMTQLMKTGTVNRNVHANSYKYIRIRHLSLCLIMKTNQEWRNAILMHLPYMKCMWKNAFCLYDQSYLTWIKFHVLLMPQIINL